MRIRADSPDGRITARLSGGSRLDVRFVPGAYERYSEAALVAQLSSALSTLFAEFQRARFEALSQINIELSGLPAVPVDPRTLERKNRRFHERRDTLQGRGRSVSDTVRVTCTGRTEVQVGIRPRTMRGMAESEFTRELLDAVAAARADYREGVRSLRVRLLATEVANAHQPVPKDGR